RPVPPAARPVVPWPGPEALVLEHRAHAPGHAALWLPDPRVLVAGDMLSDTEVPLLDLTAADPLADYRAGLNVLAPFVARAAVLVPGHGHVAQGPAVRRRLTADLAYLDALTRGVPPGIPQEPRLADPEVRQQHEAQVQRTRRR
ncbi:MBL fold metallo-hydrolase, partial [Georgenia sp. 10Sc9-8]|nr:MBL fold metallo-hydrolase [Georgenia halotolerans]